ncbi:hypothetical protein BO71DRAFT_395114 [Aspergillus ellipticus CBS 707.79]|uniref:Uncharacterized protein n=1 Tax=Aspergillus ellipticus CBS 707.79 TaxID=1448320 RepID=A0A319ECL3_9EURO|nr:hypothetical protein BO71DRAFT_395114 [Aspergillus ellipticus CBS 707.79]
MPPLSNIYNGADIAPNEMSRYCFFKDAGFNGMYEFMLSHGLKMYNLDDIAEAKEIVKTMRRYDQENWEQEQIGQKQEYYEDWDSYQMDSDQYSGQYFDQGFDQGFDQDYDGNWEAEPVEHMCYHHES